MTALSSELRKRLEKTIRQARVDAEEGARQALEALAVGRHEPHRSMSVEERALRRRLRAHGRQLGDMLDRRSGSQSTTWLEREVAYEHWHRMMFARLLAENGLLTEPASQVAITLDECQELARERGVEPWDLAASFAEGMLPRIFRADDPALAVKLPPETRQRLQRLLTELPAEVFTAGDALGWTYQFWQAAEKDAVNARVKSGEKVTGETLPAVTQLFTESYMVRFLLHNTLGAWHAGKVLAKQPQLARDATGEQDLRAAVKLEDASWEYLRFVREPLEGEEPNDGSGPWRPAAGTYPGWPTRVSELKVFDPCCGSGHFLVEAFDLLVRLRRAEEGLGMEDAIRAVLSENLFGLELDPRCTQIAAFQLALAAWRMAGRPIELPPLQVACSGLGPNASKEEWIALAETAAARAGMAARRDLSGTEDSLLSASLRQGLEQLYDTFRLAPELGSLIDPATQASDLFTAGFEQLAPLLEAVLEAESADEQQHERAIAAQGMAQAARILVGPPDGYTLVITNVPYLGRGSQSPRLREFAETHYADAKADLATIFVSRMLRWVHCKRDGAGSGTVAAVTPQNWLFLTSYKKLRERLLKEATWQVVARLGPGAFETISGEVVNVALLAISSGKPDERHIMAGLDVSAHRGQPPIPAPQKATLLRGNPTRAPQGNMAPTYGTIQITPQIVQSENPDSIIRLDCKGSSKKLFGDYVQSCAGVCTGDYSRFGRCYWEQARFSSTWHPQQTTAVGSKLDEGLTQALRWEEDTGCLREFVEAKLGVKQAGAWLRGKDAWGRNGIAVTLMQSLPVAVYRGTLFDDNVAVLVPKNPEWYLPALAFCLSEEFSREVRALNQKLAVKTQYLLKVPFDLCVWQREAADRFPDGLPEPQSDDPTQWLFHGHPARAEAHAVLQVAVARLVGYRWPAELDEEMRLAEEARALVRRCAELADHADADGIVCLQSIQGEGTAADRLRSLLARAFGHDWSAAKEEDLLRAAADRFAKGRTQPSLEHWLRDRFFDEHCSLFHKRPFVWHVWDGLPDGFHALVNYHRLAGPEGEGHRTLEKLAFTYLGEWIDRQRQLSEAGEEGADGRLAAAMALQGELRQILEGEPPYDIFVRWKPLHEQPLGWDPDINDGVRLNIRPFLMARDVRKKDAGILRVKPDNTWSNKKKPGVKDRGKEPESLRPRESFPWFWGCDPEEHPEHRIDFGAGTPGSAPAGKKFTGVRWNGLHYTRAARESARARQEE